MTVPRTNPLMPLNGATIAESRHWWRWHFAGEAIRAGWDDVQEGTDFPKAFNEAAVVAVGLADALIDELEREFDDRPIFRRRARPRAGAMTDNLGACAVTLDTSVEPVSSALSTMTPESRRRYIGSSEVASLFGLGRESRFALWHRKKGNLPDEDISGFDRVFWGSTLEPAIARGAAEKEGWQILKGTFCEHPAIVGMACHPDYEVAPRFAECPDDPIVGLLEVKNVDAMVFRDWADEIPPHIELQLQHQLACTGRTWGAFAILVGGNQLHVIRRDARPVTMRKLGEAVLEFWESIEADREPEPEWEVDLPTLSKLYGHSEAGKVIDLRAHSQANALVAEYVKEREAEKASKERKETIKAKLLPIVGDAERAMLGSGFSISCKAIAGGSVSYDRDPYRDFRITQNKKFAMAAK